MKRKAQNEPERSELRKKAEKNLAESAAQWQTTFDSVNDGICLLTTDQKIMRSNKAMACLFPEYGGDFIGKFCWEVIHKTNEPFYDCPVVKMIKSLQRETSVQKHNGKWVHVSADPIFDTENKLAGAIHIIRDITEIKQFEEELKLNYTLLHVAGETAKFGGWNVNLANNVCTWSDEVAAIHKKPAGYSPLLSESIGFYAPEWRDKITEVFANCATKGIPYDEIMQIITSEGNRVWVRTIGKPVKNENGKIVLVQGSFQDISDLKQTEESLQNAKDFAENLIQTANAIVVGLDTKGNIVTYNKAAEEITGYTLSELQGRNWFEVIVPKSRFPEVWEIFDKLMTGGLPRCFENPILTKSGKEHYIIWHNNEIREHGKIIGTISFGIDITERRQIEEALRISEYKYRALHESMMDGFIQTNMQGNIKNCNAVFMKMLGYDFEELSKLTYIDLTPEKWHDFEAEIVEKQIITRGYSDVYEKEYIRKDGTIIPVELRASLIRNKNTENQEMWAIVRDISHRKQDDAIEQTRLHLIQFSLNHSLDDFLEEMLNEAEKLTGSQISFIHFIHDNQEFLSLQNWSKRTKAEFCTATGKGSHYPISEAGVWVDCIYQRKPVIHNDYASLPHRKGLPEGHAKVIREMVVPVFRGAKITAILGVGNKAANYTQQDVETLTEIANLTWETTERMRAEEALRESEEQFHKIFDTSPIGITLVGAGFNFLHVNESFCLFSGYSENELLKLTFKDITLPDHIAGNIESLEKLAAGEIQIYETEKRYIRKDQKTTWGSSHVTAIFDNNRNFRYYLAMIKDINQRKQAEAEILRMNKTLTEANASKNKFFSIIAHDLKSPFNAIVGFSDLLLEQVREKKYAAIEKYAEIILHSSEHALQLLTNLMEWSRSQTGRIEFNPEYFEMVNFINDIVPLFEDIAGQKSITIQTGLPSNAPVYADKAMISTVLRNLISNAVKFTKPSGLITISLYETNQNLTVSVTDNGIGISKERIEKLFRLDENESTPGTQNEKGTGLGLILCKEFIEKHGGEIWVESEVGKGSTFNFSLPALTRRFV